MPDVFISYSRSDGEFVRKLHDSFVSQGRDAWVDWERIPPSSAWLNEIYDAIQAADTFIFAISPDSVDSKVCQMEVEHAVLHNKRIMPIVVHDVPPEEMHEALSAINWIFFREGDNFNQSLEQLTNAIDTDLEWVHLHTRMTVRAVEWEQRSRNNSLLLRGDGLSEAETWLSQGSLKEPHPTALHAEFINESRQAAARRSRLTLGAVSGGLVIALMLCVIAGIAAVIAVGQSNRARQEADSRATQQAIAENEADARATAQNVAETEADARATQQAIAEEQAAIAQSQALSYRAEAALEDFDIRAAFESAIEAYQTWPTVESLAALYSVSYDRTSYLPSVIQEVHNALVTFASYNSDGTRIVSSGRSPSLAVWDAAAGDVLWTADLTAGVNSASFSPDDALIVSADNTGDVIVWDADSGDMRKTLHASDANVVYAEFSPDGERILAATSDVTCDSGCDYTARIWDLDSGREITVLRGHTDYLLSAEFNFDGTRVLTSASDGTARVWDASTGRQLLVISPGFDFVNKAAFSPGGARILTVDGLSTVQIWDSQTGEQLLAFSGHNRAGIDWGDFDPSGHRIVTASVDTTIRVWDVHTGAQLAVLLGHTEPVNMVTFSPDGTDILSASGGFLCDSNCDYTARVWSRSYAVQQVPARGALATLAPDGRRLLVSRSNDVAIWDLDSDSPDILLKGHTSQLGSLTISQDGQYIVTGGGLYSRGPDCDCTARVWDAATGEQLAILRGHTDHIQDVSISSDNRRVVTGSYDGTVRLWDATTGSELGIIYDSEAYEIFSAEFSADGQYILIASHNDTVTILDAESLDTVHDFEPPDRVEVAAFNLDHSLVAVGGENGQVWLYHADRAGRTHDLLGHTAEITSLAFSPDGQWIVSGSADGSARLWDVDTGELLAVLPHEEEISSVGFSPDGTHIVTSDFLGNVRFWAAMPDELLRLAVEQVESLPD